MRVLLSTFDKLDLHTLIRLFSTLMAWALQGSKLPRGGLHYLQNALKSDIAHPLSKVSSSKFLPSTFRQFPIQSSRSFSSWARFHQIPRPNLKPKNLLLLPTPALASYTTAASSIFELDPSNSEVVSSINPCMLTVGAAWAPKRPRSNLPEWCQADCGEDAFFTILVNSNYCLGVADGVGGWSEVGVDPSQFAWELMNNCKMHCETLGIATRVDPKKVLTQAYNKLIKSGRVKAGSSTACLAVVDTDTGRLCSVNLGDSGYIIIRGGVTAYRSSETTHYFNAPYQLSVIPPEMDNGGHIRNKPSEGQVAMLQLEHGDIVVMGTDGLFDNLFYKDIEEEALTTKPVDLDRLLAQPGQSQEALRAYTNAFAGALVKKARLRAKDRKTDSPFSTEAAKHGYKFKGGKMDDITVVVALVTMKTPAKSHI
ncbi:Protein phosphatase 2C 7 [Entomophthora muscae]|uniref:Protein phosphatase 2C 7 n=1 Tax=Entomophthora muscae TaxID=34485 RepID=A0ACC2SRK9_9FUNG|nr:Protein phosphatase 2C 7 [Entomophthora muscae]